MKPGSCVQTGRASPTAPGASDGTTPSHPVAPKGKPCMAALAYRGPSCATGSQSWASCCPRRGKRERRGRPLPLDTKAPGRGGAGCCVGRQTSVPNGYQLPEAKAQDAYSASPWGPGPPQRSQGALEGAGAVSTPRQGLGTLAQEEAWGIGEGRALSCIEHLPCARSRSRPHPGALPPCAPAPQPLTTQPALALPPAAWGHPAHLVALTPSWALGGGGG